MKQSEKTGMSFSTKDLPPERFEAILASITDGVFTVNADGKITCFNKAAETITGFSREHAIGRPCREVFRANICRDACALKYTIETGRPVVNLLVYITTASGETVPVSISTSPFRDMSGRPMGGVETFRDLRKEEYLRKELYKSYVFEDIVGKSKAVKEVLELIAVVARSDSTVLITGESGSGKELAARAIHNNSRRRKGRFVAVNCASIPDTLMEAELFGHEAGAFTGAVKARKGLVARAEAGTLFLDEVGDLPMGLQGKLLRVLQERTYERLGGSETLEADVRVLAATNKDLKSMVDAGKFRNDLYYRLAVIEVQMPPLRERREDIPLLVNYFVQHFSSLQAEKRVSGVSPKVMEILMSHDYPGNIRELSNIIEHGVVVCPGSIIKEQHLPKYLLQTKHSEQLASTIQDCERLVIIKALQSTGWNRLEAARKLGMHKTTLFRKIKSLNIELPEKDGRSKSGHGD